MYTNNLNTLHLRAIGSKVQRNQNSFYNKLSSKIKFIFFII